VQQKEESKADKQQIGKNDILQVDLTATVDEVVIE